MSRLLKQIQAMQAKKQRKISLQMPAPIVTRQYCTHLRTKICMYLTSLILGILLACFFSKESDKVHPTKLSEDYSSHTTSFQTPSLQSNEPLSDNLFDNTDIEISQSQIPLAISIEPMILDETETLSELLDNSTIFEAEEPSEEIKEDHAQEITSQIISKENPQEVMLKTLPAEFEKKLSHSIKPIAHKIALFYDTSLNLSSNFIETNIKNLKDRLQVLSKFKQQGLPIGLLKGIVNSSNNNTKGIVNLTSHTTKTRNPRNNILSKISHLNARQQKHLTDIYNFLSKFRIDGIRLDGVNSRIHANGYAYHVNTFVSHHPTLKLTGITQNELIFKDENNQEYRKEISQND